MERLPVQSDMNNDETHFVGNRAKGRISKRVLQEKKARQIFWKTNISCPLIRHTYACVSGGKKSSFFGKFGVLCFLETLFWDSRFCLITLYLSILSFGSIWFEITLWSKRSAESIYGTKSSIKLHFPKIIQKTWLKVLNIALV